ncbi:MAG: ISAs1 family transposase [Gammaproteobacteria bacterium]|nr:ISAs1 family transposase [Gammaproteobacteria bacterium]
MSILPHYEDPRIDRNKIHGLIDVIVLTVCAVASGADGWEAIEQFGKEKIDWLRNYVALNNGVPSHDGIAYVLSRLSPQKFRECFMSWTRAVTEETGGEVIAIDGKTAKGSRDRKHQRNPLHMVSAWACHNRLVLGQQATQEKSNEITAIPKLLRLLELKGCIVTIDAMGCQRAIAEQIIDQIGDYVLGLKANQDTLHDAVADFFTVAQAKQFAGVVHDYVEEVDKDHGRLEIRRYYITEELCTLPAPRNWKGLRSIGMVERECLQGDTRSVEQRYFINSIPGQARPFAHAVRGHWGVENPLHWRLEVVLGDDASRIRKGNGPAIMTSIRHLCMNLFERETSSMSLAKKRRKAAWNDDYRAKVIFS